MMICYYEKVKSNFLDGNVDHTLYNNAFQYVFNILVREILIRTSWLIKLDFAFWVSVSLLVSTCMRKDWLRFHSKLHRSIQFIFSCLLNSNAHQKLERTYWMGKST